MRLLFSALAVLHGLMLPEYVCFASAVFGACIIVVALGLAFVSWVIVCGLLCR